MDESENMSQGGATRRAVLAGLAGATALAALPVTVSAGIAPVAAPMPAEMPASFLTASSKLCGLPLDKSYIELAGTIWKTLTASGDQTFLEVCRIAAAAPDEAALRRALVDSSKYWPATKALISLWYTGMSPDRGENPKVSKVVTYNDALAWTVCSDFTKPPATCGGPFGYWHEQPPA
jgi:hypothetical protein